MPDFSAQLVGSAIAPWRDPAQLPNLPSRVNPSPTREMQRLTLPVGAPAIIRATVNGVTAPLDSALDGRLFVGWLAESPVPRPIVTITPGKSSERTFTPAEPGHYTYVLHRAGGGGIILHFDAVAS